MTVHGVLAKVAKLEISLAEVAPLALPMLRNPSIARK